MEVGELVGNEGMSCYCRHLKGGREREGGRGREGKKEGGGEEEGGRECVGRTGCYAGIDAIRVM